MRAARFILIAIFIALLAATLTWLAKAPARPVSDSTRPQDPPVRDMFRLGLIPERDIFLQRRAHEQLAAYIEKHLGVAVTLVTNNSYLGVVDDLGAERIDAAFAGSLVAVLAVDRHDARVILKSDSIEGNSTYAGVVFVRTDSPVTSFAELAGRTLGAVRTTTAGPVFSVFLQTMPEMRGSKPKFVWSGTHDDVIREVIAGRIDAGAVKDTRLDAYLRANPGASVRRLAESQRVPDNALLVRRSYPAERMQTLARTLLAMSDEEEGREVLRTLGLRAYKPCTVEEYAPLYGMIERIGDEWAELGISGPPPRRRGAQSRAQYFDDGPPRAASRKIGGDAAPHNAPAGG